MSTKQAEFSSDDLVSLYRAHPCNSENILARLSSEKNRDQISVTDLAYDPVTELTDQNHVGGTEFVRALAEAAHITVNDHILDLGCGLGGPARILASEFDCCVTGIDISPDRIVDARKLTELVGLSHRISFDVMDLRNCELPDPDFTCLWGQGAWVHIRDKQTHLGRWCQALKNGARIAMEDTFIQKIDTPEDEARLDRLASLWMAEFPTKEQWQNIFEPGYHVLNEKILTGEFIEYFQRLDQCTDPSQDDESLALEREGWRLAVELARSGVIGYIRIVFKNQDN